jgi:hypothetical protein
VTWRSTPRRAAIGFSRRRATSSARSACSGQPLGKTADVLRSGIALKLDRDELFDLLGERPELLRQLFEGMFRMGTEAATAPASA